jgi:hypothetical protein
MRLRKLLLAAATAALAASALALPASAGTPATVFVAHGIPGAVVDVCVNGDEVRSRFKYGRQFKAELPAGDYRVKLYLADPRECRGIKVVDQQLALTDGLNATAVARIIQGAPGLQVFVNDLDIDGPGASLTVRHTAKAPSVDVYLAGTVQLAVNGLEPTIADFPRGASAGPVTVKPNTYAWWVTLANQSTPVIGPAVAPLEEGVAYQVHAVGTKPANFRFIVIAQPGNVVP